MARVVTESADSNIANAGSVSICMMVNGADSHAVVTGKINRSDAVGSRDQSERINLASLPIADRRAIAAVSEILYRAWLAQAVG